MVAAVEAIAGGRIASFEHGLNARVFQHATASLQHDRMIIDDQNAGHDLVSCSGMTMRTQVPHPVALSTLQLPPTACARSCMRLRPRSGAAMGSMAHPSSQTVG